MRVLTVAAIALTMLGTAYASTQTSSLKSEWLKIGETEVGTLYTDMRSIRADPEYLSDGVIHWDKIVLKKAAEVGGYTYDEMYELVNVDCNKRAIKIDERILKLNGKTVYRQTRDDFYIHVYNYPEPGSMELTRVEDACYIWNGIREAGYSSFAELQDSIEQ